jgi:hypothetical protein
MVRLTNKVLLPSTDHQRDEADHANQRGRETEHESEVDGGLVVFALDVGEEEEGECVDCKRSANESPQRCKTSGYINSPTHQTHNSTGS